MPFLPSFEESATQLDIFRRWPEIARPLGELAQQFMRNGPFNNAQAELIFAYTSGVNACQYCYGIHKRTAEMFGVKEGLLESLLEDLDSSPIEASMKPILRFVRKLTQSPAKMMQTDVDAILEADWDETAFHYAISICALANYFNRILDAHGIHATPEYHAAAADRLSRIAYNDLETIIGK